MKLFFHLFSKTNPVSDIRFIYSGTSKKDIAYLIKHIKLPYIWVKLSLDRFDYNSLNERSYQYPVYFQDIISRNESELMPKYPLS